MPWRRSTTAQAALDTQPVVTLDLLLARNVAVVDALAAGVAEALVERATGLREAALELAVARGRYCTTVRTGSLAHADSRG